MSQQQFKSIDHAQRGMTLISLLIGLFISLMCILASLTVYKNLIFVAADTKVDAMHDGQLAAAMLTVQKEVMTAGFGIADADNSHLVRRTVAADGSTPGSNELLWRYMEEDGTFVCRGIKESYYKRDNSDIDFRQLAMREVQNGCTENASLTGLQWSDVDILGKWRLVGALATYITTNDNLLSFTISEQTCSPYGTTELQDHYSVQISAPSSAQLNGAASATATSYDFCLPNTYPPAS